MSEDKSTSTQELITKIEQGIEAARTSEGFVDYLNTAAKFHKYSFGNTMLILLQRPQATHVAGFHTWISLGRAVRKGEHGIRILAPCVSRKAKDEDEDTKSAPVFFRTVSVFDVEQTDGKELPSPVSLLTGDDCGLFARLQVVAETSGLTVSRDPSKSHGSANGYFVKSESLIWVSPDLEPVMACKTLSHELGHFFANHEVEGHCREEAETIAESVAYIVMASQGIDSGCYTFGYIATWSDAKTFKAKVSEIQKAASTIITKLED